MVKPSILLVGNFLSPKGGNRTTAEEFALRLEDAGHLLVTTSEIRSRLFRLPDMLSTVFFQRKTYQIAYVEVYSGTAFLWAEVVSTLLDILRKPYILTLHGGNLPAFARRWPRRIKRLLKGAGTVTAPSRYLQEAMSTYREDIFLIPNPLEIQNYPYRLHSASKPHIVWLRAFHNIYNPQMAPLAIATLRTSYPEIKLTMIGPDKGDGTLQETRRLIEKLGLQKNIEIIPGISKNKVSEYLGNADIFINTTDVDNTPVSVLEALACGLCVVSTNVGGIPHLLQDGVDALLVPPDDPQAMADVILHLLREPELAERLSRNARKKAEQFDWSVILPQWEALFSEVINRHGGWQS